MYGIPSLNYTVHKFRELIFLSLAIPLCVFEKKNRKYSLYETKLCDSVVWALLWPPF